MDTNLKREISWLLRDKYNGVESEEFRQDVKQLESGFPLAHLIGWVPFFGAKIYLDSKPLIPRGETEYLVSNIAQSLESRDLSDFSILDLCAGSGCIGVALAKKFTQIKVNFAEIDTTHHETIRKNLKENGIEKSRVNIFGGNLFENITGRYDLIITNPPYIDASLKRVPKSVLNYEPHIALFGGDKGMELIEQILKEYGNYLKENGELYIEHEPEQIELISKFFGFKETLKDQFGVNRFSRFGK